MFIWSTSVVAENFAEVGGAVKRSSVNPLDTFFFLCSIFFSLCFLEKLQATWCHFLKSFKLLDASGCTTEVGLQVPAERTWWHVIAGTVLCVRRYDLLVPNSQQRRQTTAYCKGFHGQLSFSLGEASPFFGLFNFACPSAAVSRLQGGRNKEQERDWWFGLPAHLWYFW